MWKPDIPIPDSTKNGVKKKLLQKNYESDSRREESKGKRIEFRI